MYLDAKCVETGRVRSAKDVSSEAAGVVSFGEVGNERIVCRRVRRGRESFGKS
jgi:hypothetical protein